jgi:hypothetical protein
MNPNSGLFPIIILALVLGAGIIISLGAIWMQNRPKMRMIDVLRAYAEKGEDPPVSVVDTLAKLSWPFPPPPPPRRQTRGDHLAHFAGSIVIALGASGVAWWRMNYGDPSSPLPIVAVMVAIFFYASAAARLVGAVTSGDGDR